MPEDQRFSTCQILHFSEVEFHERLVQFFRPFVSISPMDWTCIQKSVTYFVPFFKFDKLVDLFFDYIFALFEDFRITDGPVIDYSFTKYFRFILHHNVGRSVSDNIPMDDPQDYYYSNVPQYLEQLPSYYFVFHIPSIAMRVLRYVVPVRENSTGMRHLLTHVLDCIKYDSFVLDNVDCFQWNEVDDLVETSRSRLILMTLYFVLIVRNVRNENIEGFIRGFKLLFQAIPDTYVSWQEIFGFLTRTFSPNENIKHSYIKSFQESLLECFPECPQMLKPRSLKHLARCEVRKCLGRAHALPHGVWSLRLPRILEDYVMLQTRKDQFRPVIGPLSTERVFVIGPVPETLGQGRS